MKKIFYNTILVLVLTGYTCGYWYLAYQKAMEIQADQGFFMGSDLLLAIIIFILLGLFIYALVATFLYSNY